MITACWGRLFLHKTWFDMALPVKQWQRYVKAGSVVLHWHWSLGWKVKLILIIKDTKNGWTNWGMTKNGQDRKCLMVEQTKSKWSENHCEDDNNWWWWLNQSVNLCEDSLADVKAEILCIIGPSAAVQKFNWRLKYKYEFEQKYMYNKSWGPITSTWYLYKLNTRWFWPWRHVGRRSNLLLVWWYFCITTFSWMPGRHKFEPAS